MIQQHHQLISDYRSRLLRRGIDDDKCSECIKWLHHYLHFCEKYCVTGDGPQRMRLFLGMLREKKKSDEQRRQAMYAITLYFEMVRHKQYTKASAMIHNHLTGDQVPQSSTGDQSA